jgi:hypothetical protein
MVAATVRAAQQQTEERVMHLSQERDNTEAELASLKEEASRLVSAGEREGAPGSISGRLRELNVQIEAHEQALERIAGEQEALAGQHATAREVIDGLTSLNEVWEELYPAEQERIVQLLVSRVEVGTDGLHVQLRADGLESLVVELRPGKNEEVLV